MLGEAQRSLLWSGVQQVIVLGCQFGLGILLARLLNPYDFGVVAMQGIFFAISNAFIDCGLEGALIQKRDCTKEDTNSAFVYSLTVSILLYLLLFFSAPFIEEYFHTPNLQKVIRVSAIVLVLNALGIVPRSLLQRRLHFKSLALVTTSSTLIAGVVAVIMAYNGYAYWALVCHSLLTAVLLTTGYYIFAHWHPGTRTSNESYRQLLSFGVPMMFSSLMNGVYSNLYSLMIGRAYNPQQLGVFNRAEGYSNYLSYNLSDLSMRALYPILSKSQDDLQSLKIQALKIIHATAFVAIPAIVFLVFNVEDIILLLLTNKWMSMAPLMKVITIASFGYVVLNLHVNLFKAVGKTQILFVCEMTKKFIGVLVLLITIRYGLQTMAWGMFIVALINMLISSLFVSRFIGITISEQLKQLYVIIMIALVSVWICTLFISQIEVVYLRLIISAITYFAIYGLLSYVLKLPALEYLRTFFK